ncbi:MAG: class I SAM-dependent methyltransferase [Coriobacteriia bacterium]
MLHRLRARRTADGRHDTTGSPPLAAGGTINPSPSGDWYSLVLTGASTLGEYARAAECLERALDVTTDLASDPYADFLGAFYRGGLDTFGTHWGYADISTALVAVSHLLHPTNYLEIGVRKGRSMAMVSSASPDCDMVGFDMWMQDYAGIENPGPDFVRGELERLGHQGGLEFIDGDSHTTVPAYFEDHPDAFFDLITVDGDHSPKGAEQDLRDVMPRLSIGGVLVFDDIVHPAHPELAGVWDRVVVSDSRFSSWTYTDIGYGVAVAVRRA